MPSSFRDRSAATRSGRFAYTRSLTIHSRYVLGTSLTRFPRCFPNVMKHFAASGNESWVVASPAGGSAPAITTQSARTTHVPACTVRILSLLRVSWPHTSTLLWGFGVCEHLCSRTPNRPVWASKHTCAGSNPAHQTVPRCSGNLQYGCQAARWTCQGCDAAKLSGRHHDVESLRELRCSRTLEPRVCMHTLFFI